MSQHRHIYFVIMVRISKPHKAAFIMFLKEITGGKKPEMAFQIADKWLGLSNKKTPHEKLNRDNWIGLCLESLQDPSENWKLQKEPFPKNGLEELFKLLDMDTSKLRKDQIKKYLPETTQILSDVYRTVQLVNANYSLGYDDSILTKVAERFALLKPALKDDGDWVEAIKSSVPNVNNNPLEVESKKQAVAINQICAICKTPGKEITLLGNRKAYYCSTHRVVTPTVKQS